MTTPTIELVRPAAGWSGGNTLVEITGTGFQVPTPGVRRASAPLPAPAPTMAVLFDGKPATAVQVVSPTLLRCLTPRHPPSRLNARGEIVTRGLVDVTLQNLDGNGAVLAGEEAVAASVYEFKRPELGTVQSTGLWLRVYRAVIDHLQNVLLENVRANPSVDYDADTGDFKGYVELAQLPGIALTSVRFPQSLESEAQQPMVEIAPGRWILQKPPVVRDLSFKLVIVSNSQGELLNLCEALTHVLATCSTIEVATDAGDPTPVVDFQMQQAGDLGVNERLGGTDVMTAEVEVTVLRLTSQDVPGAPTQGLPGAPGYLGHEGTRGVTRGVESFALGGARKA